MGVKRSEQIDPEVKVIITSLIDVSGEHIYVAYSTSTTLSGVIA